MYLFDTIIGYPSKCEAATHDCSEHAECKNVPGFWSCKCPFGFNGTGYPVDPCMDRNECLEGLCLDKFWFVWSL